MNKIKTKNFYNQLAKYKIKRGILGIDQRFSSNKILASYHIRESFLGLCLPNVKKNYKVLDFGCGTGAFSFLISPYVKHLDSADISSGLLNIAEVTQKKLGIKNIDFHLLKNESLPFPDSSFDTILILDTIHHLSDPKKNIKEIYRVLKKGGKIICFEPNKKNPLIYLIHLIDPNERGLLKLGTCRKYQKIFSEFKLERFEYLGLVIGPDSLIFKLALRIINFPLLFGLLKFLNPKISLIYTKA
jgi:SAM-dependent methyltransferase